MSSPSEAALKALEIARPTRGNAAVCFKDRRWYWAWSDGVPLATDNEAEARCIAHWISRLLSAAGRMEIYQMRLGGYIVAVESGPSAKSYEATTLLEALALAVNAVGGERP